MTDGLHPVEASALHARRERVFLVLAGLFLGSLTMLNILGITRFLDFSFELFGMTIPMQVAIGVLPYPITFLCTDFISEFYGRKRANAVVWTGLLLNLWVALILYIGGALPGTGADPVTGELVRDAAGRLPVFFEVRDLAFGAMFASMFAYLVAQLVDVRLFHFWKRLTGGKHLWLRNNGSTLVSQLVDSTAVILVTSWVASEALPAGVPLIELILAGYVFKLVIALIDTGPFYLGVRYLRGYLQLDPNAELGATLRPQAGGQPSARSDDTSRDRP